MHRELCWGFITTKWFGFSYSNNWSKTS